MGDERARGRVALVTGASSGFGLLTALTLGKSGFSVFATVRSDDKKSELVRAADAAAVELQVLTMDLAKADARSAAVRAVYDRAGRIDVLVNNAGYGLGGFAEDVSEEELRQQFDTNFFGTVELTKLVLPGMRERRSGAVIVLSSMAGVVASPGVSSYCASKFALEGYFDALNYELAPFDVNVSLIEPGQFRTRALTAYPVARRSELPSSAYFKLCEFIKALIAKRVAGLSSDPQDVADLIARIALARSPRCRYAVGADARVFGFLQRFLPEMLFRGTLRTAIRLVYRRLERGGAAKP
ncbi:MAG TPA: SDR family NAD(P)-dependent oxidoreductase [Polyangiaceae bacterium]|nr:SDR family NAD(P)-dependent oxidoreductase [Polyangiaceae bacterium]